MQKALKAATIGLILLSVTLSGCRRVTNRVSPSDPYGAKSYRQYDDEVVYDTVPKSLGKGYELSRQPSTIVLKDDRVRWHLHEHTEARHRWVAQPPKGTRLFLHLQGRFVVKGEGEGGKLPEWRSLAIDIDLDADSNRNGRIDEEPAGEDNTTAEDSVEEAKPGALLCKESELIIRKIKVNLDEPPVKSASGKVIVKRSDRRQFDIRRKADDPTTSIFEGNKKDSLNFFDEVKSHDVRLWMVPLAKAGDGNVKVKLDAKIELKGRAARVESVKFEDKVHVYTTRGLRIDTETVATQPEDRTRKTIGVGEEVRLTLEPDGLSPITWSLTGPGSLDTTTGPTVVFTAHDRRSKPTITATWSECRCSVSFDVIEPSSLLFENSSVRVAGAPPAQKWIGIVYFAKVYSQPDTVNFYNINLYESSAAPVKKGYFKDKDIPDHQANGPHDIAGYAAGKGSLMRKLDWVGGHASPEPFKNGTVTYPLDWLYAVGSGAKKKIQTIDQTATLKATPNEAVFRIEKGDSGYNISTKDGVVRPNN